MFVVFVEDNGRYMDEESRYRHSDWPTYAEAVAAAQRLVNLSLAEAYQPGMSAAAVYAHYTSFGDDAFVVPDENEPRFSAWDYARSRAEELCHGDT